jgi:Ca2+/Na+ antiporter
LLLVSRPRTAREWFWIVTCIAALIAWFRVPTSLTEQTVRAAAVFYTGAFVALTLLGVRSLLTRASVAVLVGALAMVGWYLVFHLRLADVQNEIVTQTWEAWRKVWTDLPASVPSGDALEEGGVADRARQLASAITALAFLFPASLALIALASARLTWSWYHRIARTPILPPAAPFREFRFSDHLVWLLVALIAPFLLPVPPPVTLVAANALVVVGSFYVLRGGAIAGVFLRRASPFFIGILLLIMLPFFYIVPIGLAMLGIADTWLDFRRRAAPTSGVPS